MAGKTITNQGRAWDQYARDAYGEERLMDAVIRANADEADTLLFSGGLELAVPEGDAKMKAVSTPPPWEREGL